MSEQITIVLQHVGKSLSTGQPLAPPEFVVDGNDTIQLPSAEQQKSGFSLSTDAETLRIARLFPTLYKRVVAKDGTPIEPTIATEVSSEAVDDEVEENTED